MGKQLLALREKHTQKLFNVAYSEEGLKWTTNDKGEYVYYQNARIRQRDNKLLIDGKKNNNLYVTTYKPMKPYHCPEEEVLDFKKRETALFKKADLLSKI
jgi:hypothetical protein